MKCTTCGVPLVVGVNWFASRAKAGQMTCRKDMQALQNARRRRGADSARHSRIRHRKCKVHPECAKIDRAEVLRRGAGICGICGRRVRKTWHMDHIKPVNKGGIHCYLNLQPSHVRCNLRKGDKYPFIILRKDPDVRTT